MSPPIASRRNIDRAISNLLEGSPHHLAAVLVALRRPQHDGLHRLQAAQEPGLVQLQHPAVSVILAVGQVYEWVHDDEAHGEGDEVHRAVGPSEGLVQERLVHDGLRAHMGDLERRRADEENKHKDKNKTLIIKRMRILSYVCTYIHLRLGRAR